MAPQVLATFRAIFTGPERGKAFGIYGAMLGFASGVGLLLGGVLTDANLFGWGWRSVFFVNVPVSVCALIAGRRFVPETKDPAARRPDVPGAILLAGSLVAIVYPLLEGRQLGWPTWVWLMLTAGLAVLMVTEPAGVFLTLSTVATIVLVAAGTGASTLWFLAVLRRLGLRLRFAPP